MNKRLSFIKAILIAFAALALCFCNKNDKYPLEGSTWVSTQSGKMGSSSWEETYTLKFQKTTFNLIYVEVMNGKTNTTNTYGTYSYEEPFLTLYDENNNPEPPIKVSGDVIEYNGLVFIKQ